MTLRFEAAGLRELRLRSRVVLFFVLNGLTLVRVWAGGRLLPIPTLMAVVAGSPS
jgi:hypothetical protein